MLSFRVLSAWLALLFSASPSAAQCTQTVTSHAQLKALLESGTLVAGDVVCANFVSDSANQPIQIAGSGAPSNPIVIRGERQNGSRPRLQGAPDAFTTAFFHFLPSSSYWVLEGFELTGATHSATNTWEGPCAARIEGDDITIRDCESHGNGVGFLSWIPASRVLIENCEVHGNGRHNLNMFAESVTVRGCYLHDCAPNSVQYKERCRISVLEGNWIERTGNGGYEVDFAGTWTGRAVGSPRAFPYEDSYALMIGNVIIHDNSLSTPTVVNLGDGSPDAHFAPRRGYVDLIHNTIIATTANSTVMIRRIHEAGNPQLDPLNNTCTALLRLQNNIVHNTNAVNGFGNLVLGTFDMTPPGLSAAWLPYPTQGSNNWFSCSGSGIVQTYAPAVSASTYGIDPGFVSSLAPLDPSLAVGTSIDCNSRAGAPARDAALGGPLRAEPRLLAQGGNQQYRYALPLLEPRGAHIGTWLRRDGALRDLGAIEGSSLDPRTTDLALGGSPGVGRLSSNILPGPLRIGLAPPPGSLYVLYLSSGLLPNPLVLPGIQGGLWLDPFGAFFFSVLQGFQHADPERPELLELPIPFSPQARGAAVAMQLLTVDLQGSGAIAWSSSAPRIVLL